MKKFLTSLVLVTVLSTVAFADGTCPGQTGTSPGEPCTQSSGSPSTTTTLLVVTILIALIK